MKKFTSPLYLVIAAVVVVLLGVGGFVIYKSQSVAPAPSIINSGKNVKKLSASDIGLTVTVRPDKKGVILKIAKLDGIASLEYSLSYDANVTDAGETGVVPRGVQGSQVLVKPGDSVITRNLDLGTCSQNVCKYDQVVSDITVTIRVNYKNGIVGGVEEKISLNKK